MSDRSRIVEAWTWYGIASSVIVSRFVSRSIHLGGWKNLKLEDFAMVLTFGFYTNVIVWVNIQTRHPNTNILPDTGMAGLTPADIDDRIYGSKVAFVIEESMIMTQWGCKVCMCLLYYKLTESLRAQLFVKILIGYVAFGWVLIEIFFFGVWCRPFSGYFTVGDDISFQCQVPMKHLIMSYFFNVSSDLLMLFVPLPLFLRSRLAWKQKMIVCCIFGLGIFVIIAATLNRVYTWAYPTSILWIFWYVREASTAVLVTNLPHCYALLRRTFNLGAFNSIGRHRSTLERTSQGEGTQGRALDQIYRNKRGMRIKDPASESATEINADDPQIKIWQQNEFTVEVQDKTDETRIN